MSIMWHVKYNPRRGEWRVYDENWYYVAGYKTHAEALAYADQQARTVTLVLPPVNPDQSIQGDYEGSFPMRVRRNWYGETALSIPGSRTFAITHEERKKLALYLLAEHYHHERNQK